MADVAVVVLPCDVFSLGLLSGDVVALMTDLGIVAVGKDPVDLPPT